MILKWIWKIGYEEVRLIRVDQGSVQWYVLVSTIRCYISEIFKGILIKFDIKEFTLQVVG